MKTTLNQIQEMDSFGEFPELLVRLGKKSADDEPLEVSKIIDLMGFEYAMRILQTVKDREKELRLFAVCCAKRVQHLMSGDSLLALRIAEKYAHGAATRDDLIRAGNLVWNADMEQESNEKVCAALAAHATTLSEPDFARKAAGFAYSADENEAIFQEAQLRELCSMCDSEDQGEIPDSQEPGQVG